MAAKTATREQAKATIDRSIRKAIAAVNGKAKWRLVEFLNEVRGRSDLLRPARLGGRVDGAWLDVMLDALRALHGHRASWIRPIATWEPAGSGPLPIFSSLAHHLLASYPVPPVLLGAWFSNREWEGWRQQQWFIRAGQGQSLRGIGLPLDLSRRMAHEFAQAPAHYPIGYAIRWAQVRGLDGADGLARAIAATRLGSDYYPDEGPFWETLIHWFRNHPRFDLARVDAVVEYLQERKFEQRQATIGEGVSIYLGPPEPDLAIKGWSAASLLRRVDEWQARGPAAVARTWIGWDRSAIGEFAARDDSGRAWTIRELLDSDALAAEGVAMDHCVATYTDHCSKRLATVWSVGIEGADGRARAATVEVDPATRRVVQAQARSNERPDAACLEIIRRWAGREALGWDE